MMIVNPVGEEVRTGFEAEVPWNGKPYKVTTPRKLEYVPKDQVPVYPIAQQPSALSSVITDQRCPTPPLPPPPPPCEGGQAPPPPPPPPPPPTMSVKQVNTAERKIPPINSPPPATLSPVISVYKFPTTASQPLVVPIKMSPAPSLTTTKKSPAPSLTITFPMKIPAPPPPPPPILARKAPAPPQRSAMLPANRNPPKQTIRPNGPNTEIRV